MRTPRMFLRPALVGITVSLMALLAAHGLRATPSASRADAPSLRATLDQTGLRFSEADGRYILLFRSAHRDPWVVTCFELDGRVFMSAEVAALPAGREWPQGLPLWLLTESFSLVTGHFAIDPEEDVVYLRHILPAPVEPKLLRETILELAATADAAGPEVLLRIEHEAAGAEASS
jgi:hypothetical protein